jgi:putative hydrolase of the HAD superfamily
VKHIRTLTFDLDDTLWDNRAVLMAAEQALYDWLDGNYPRIAQRYSLEAMRRMRIDLVRQDPGWRNRISELRKHALRLAARAVGYTDALVEPAFAVFLEARHRITLYDDVIPALQQLRHAGYRLGSMTNGNADVHRLGIGPLFDFSLTAESVGRAKPHPRLFEEACRVAGVAPAEVAHVGDEAATDLAGGLAAGVRVIWMNRLEQPPAPGITPHAEVRDMAELLAMLGVDTPEAADPGATAADSKHHP